MPQQANFHKILEDKTRQKIIKLLKEEGSLSYTDLMENSDLALTHLFDYHLKVLGDLIEKNEAGKYLLSEKGQLAYRELDNYSIMEAGAKTRLINISIDFNKMLFIFIGGGVLGGGSWLIILILISQTEFYKTVFMQSSASLLIWAMSLFICWAIGGYRGYLIGKRRNYEFPQSKWF